ncbi:MAG: hypothetical protein ACRDT6_27050 [Micromonosporaceae bacterium]
MSDTTTRPPLGLTRRFRRWLAVALAAVALTTAGIVAANSASAASGCRPDLWDSHGVAWIKNPYCTTNRWRKEYVKRNNFYIELVAGRVYTDSGSSIAYTYNWARVRGSGYSTYGYIAVELYDTYNGSRWSRRMKLSTRTYTYGGDPNNSRTRFRACYLNSSGARVQCTPWSW